MTHECPVRAHAAMHGALLAAQAGIEEEPAASAEGAEPDAAKSDPPTAAANS